MQTVLHFHQLHAVFGRKSGQRNAGHLRDHLGDYLFVGGFKGKSMLVKLATDKPGAEVVWKDKKDTGMSPVKSTAKA